MIIGSRNLATLADDALERFGDRESLFFEGEWLRAAALHERTTRIAGGLRDIGVSPGERVVVYMSNCPEVGLAYNAIWRAGAVTTPAIFLLPPDELRHVLANSEAAAVITTPEFLPNVHAARDGVETLRHVVCVGQSGDGVVDFADLEAAEPVGITPRANDDLAALLYTGGTTGRAKGVALTHENLWHCGRGAAEAGSVEGITRTLVPLPLAHAYGLAVTVASGHVDEPGSAVLMRWFDPTGFLGLIEEHRVQRATVVPSMLQILLSQPLEDIDLSSLAFMNCGSAPLSREVAEEFERRVPSVTILEGYGCTESGGIAATNPPDARKLGTVGRPLPGYEIRVVDDEGEEVAPGETGEVVIRSPGVMSGYWQDPAATQDVMVDDWFRTGDIGQMDDEGYLTVVDRKKDLIIRGGFNVYPRDVEEALLEHEAVAMAGVVGRPDERYGEEIIAFVSLIPGADVSEDELAAYAKERLGGYKYPREVRIVDQVPLTPVMKIDRKALRELV